MTPEQDRKVTFVVSDAVEEAVRMSGGCDAPDWDDDIGEAFGSRTAVAIAFWSLAIAAAFFFIGAAWRGAQIMGG